MKNFKDLVFSFLVGVGIGCLVECVISFFIGDMVVGVPSFIATHNPVFVKVVQTLLYGGFGIVGTGGAKLLHFNNKNLLLVTLLHMLLLLIYFSFVGVYLHWFNLGASYFYSLVIFIIIYMCIWTIIYFSEKQKIAKINEKLTLRNH